MPTEPLELIVLVTAAITALGYLLRGVRRGVRGIDRVEKVVTELPQKVADLTSTVESLGKRLGEVETQRAADQEAQESAHSEMLSVVSAVDAKVEHVAERLDDQDEQLAGLTRELDVPVRSQPTRPRRRRVA